MLTSPSSVLIIDELSFAIATCDVAAERAAAAQAALRPFAHVELASRPSRCTPLPRRATIPLQPPAPSYHRPSSHHRPPAHLALRRVRSLVEGALELFELLPQLDDCFLHEAVSRFSMSISRSRLVACGSTAAVSSRARR